MEQTSYFSTFLTDVVNLPSHKLDDLDERVDRIFKALKKADLGTRVLGMKKQGSWAQRTIINPVEGQEFDADFMVELEEQHGWTPSDYHDVVFTALEAYVEAQNINTPAEDKNRCVRVIYANSMHVDVVPYVNRADGGQCIVNTDTDDWEETDPDGLTAWMLEKDEITNNNLRLVLRLLKYLRDHRDYYKDTKSVILTTIVGSLVTHEKIRQHPGCYDSTPKALQRITRDLADWVSDQDQRPEVEDPSPNATTSFTHRWLQSEYAEFRRDIQDVANLVEVALNCSTSWSDSTHKWRELFGDKFGPADGGSTGSKFPATGAAAGAASGVATSTGRSGRAG